MSLASHKAGSAPRGRPSPGEAPSCSTVGGPAAGLGAPKGVPKTCGVLAVPCPAPASPRDGAPGGWCSGSQGACRPGSSPGGGLASAARRGEHRPLRVCQNPRNARRWPAVWTVGFGRRRWIRVGASIAAHAPQGGTWGAEGPAGLLRFPLEFSAGLRLLLKNNPFLYFKKNTASCKAATYK